MLVLSRKKDEKVVIGDDVVVTVIEVRGDVVKLGISAPREVPVYRAELLEAIKQANIEASSHTAEDLDLIAKRFKKDR